MNSTGAEPSSPRSEHPNWLPKDSIPPDEAWRPRPGMSRDQRSAEQDQAAGGRDSRLVKVGDDKWSTASVELKRLAKGRRVYGYLRYTSRGRTVNRYIGEVTAVSREAALRRAWTLARERGLTADWSSS